MKRIISILSAALLCCTSVAGTSAFAETTSVQTIVRETEFWVEFPTEAVLNVTDVNGKTREYSIYTIIQLCIRRNGEILFDFFVNADKESEYPTWQDITLDTFTSYATLSFPDFDFNASLPFQPQLTNAPASYREGCYTIYDISMKNSGENCTFVLTNCMLQYDSDRFSLSQKNTTQKSNPTIGHFALAFNSTDQIIPLSILKKKYKGILNFNDTIIEIAFGDVDYSKDVPKVYTKGESAECKIEYAATEKSTPDTPVMDGVALEGVKYLATMFPDDYAQPLEDYLYTATLKTERNGDTIKLSVIPDDTAKFNRCSWGAFVLPSGSAIANSSGISPELKESGFVNGERFFQIPMYTELGSAEDAYYGTAGFTTYDADFKEGETAYSVEILLPENCTANCFQAFGETFYLDTLEKAVEGDVNRDGKFNIADLVMFQNFLLGKTDDLPCWENANLCNNGVDVEPFFSGCNVSRLASHNMKANLDVFDLCLMRRKLIESAE